MERGAVEIKMKADEIFWAGASRNDFWMLVDTKYCNMKKCAENNHSCLVQIIYVNQH